MAKASLVGLTGSVPVEDIYSYHSATHIKWQTFIRTTFVLTADLTLKYRFIVDDGQKYDYFKKWCAIPFLAKIEALELGDEKDIPVGSTATTESGESESETISPIFDPVKTCTMSKRSGLQSIHNEDMPTEVDNSQSCEIERSNLRNKATSKSGRRKHTLISGSKSKVNKRAAATRMSVSSREGFKPGVETDDWAEISICSNVRVIEKGKVTP